MAETTTKETTGFLAVAWFEMGMFGWGQGETEEKALVKLRQIAKSDFKVKKGLLRAVLFKTTDEEFFIHERGTVYGADGRDLMSEAERIRVLI